MWVQFYGYGERDREAADLFDSHYCARGHFNLGYQTNRKEVMTGRAVSHRDCLNPFETVE